MTFALRVLGLTADAPPEDGYERLRAVRLLLLAHLTTELTISFLRWSVSPAPVLDPLVLATVSALTMILALIPRAARFSAPIAALIVSFVLIRYFPNVANHTFFLFLVLVTLSFFDLRSEEERGYCLSSIRWVIAIVFFSTGIQKVLHGTYFHGEFLAFQVAHSERFADLFRLALDPREFDRLRELGAASGQIASGGAFRAYETAPPEVGAGPYRFTGVSGLAISNGVVLFELIAPFFLIVRRTRSIAAIVVIAFLLFVELGAYEIMFGVLFVGLMLTFFRTNWIGRLLPLVCAAYVYLIGVHAGWFPRWWFN